jgi:hypothetical protein
MAILTDYTTPDTVRAILGVSLLEIADAIVLNPVYAVMMTERIADLDPGLDAEFKELPADPAARTTNQQRFSDLMQTIVAYFLAQQLMKSVKMFAPQLIQDNKTQMARVADPYADLRDSVVGTLSYLSERTLAVYQLLNPTLPVILPQKRVFAVNSPIGFDPVTNQ